MAGAPPADEVALALPPRVRHVLAVLTRSEHEAAVVGGAVRSAVLGVPHVGDWDLATSARPEEVAGLFEGSTWENRFGTVTIGADPAVEVTSYRTEGTYRDRRRPAVVRFGASLEEDLARRDFTVNAMAWVPRDIERGIGVVVDPHGGADDLAAGVLRTVGDASERFDEDALRLLRAPRFAAILGLRIDEATAAAIRSGASAAAAVSGERVRDELVRILEGSRPSDALRLLEALGLLAVVLPEVAALRGVPQAKRVPGDALDHTFATVDAVAASGDRERILEGRLTALLHDIGKATTLRDGHFLGHDRVGAELARAVLRRLRFGAGTIDRIVGAIRHHMEGYDPSWSDAAVRRYIRRTAATDRELLWALRRADDTASGAAAEGAPVLADLERRVAAEIASQPALLVEGRLAIDGDDLQRELGLPPGPEIGRILDHLRRVAVDDPERNERAALVALARAVHAVPGRTDGTEPPGPAG